MKYKPFENEDYNGYSKNYQKKLFSVCELFVVGCLSISLLLLICYLNLIIPTGYETVFEKIYMETKFDDVDSTSLLPLVNVNLKNKKIEFQHRLVPSIYSEETKSKTLESLKNATNKDSFFRILWSSIKSLTNNFKIKLQTNQFLHLNQNKDYQFKIEKINSRTDSIDCFEVSLKNTMNHLRTTGETEVCFNLGNNSWFGGHESYSQPYWPINTQSFDYVAYVTGFADDWGALLERYWLSTSGIAVFVDEDIPLFVNHNDPNKICLKSSYLSLPYKYTPVYNGNTFEYKVCSGPDIKTVHMFMVENYLGKPISQPDLAMMKYPVFTTWNFYFRHINQSVILDYARQISEHNYTVSQIEIDDLWENKYGDLDFDINKFPNVREMVSEMHAMNQRVTLWVHPFCNIDSYNFVNGTVNGYWVKDAQGIHPGFTQWWNGANAAILDTTNPLGVEYFTNKLNLLKEKYEIDSFKFDAGETHWIPQEYKLFNNQSKPDKYAQNYVEIAARQNNFVEVRTAYRTQKHGIFYRILDRASDWTIHDGLKSVITATLHFGLLGYPFVLPDIIGGNGDPDKSNKELFIRWAQLNAFLPAMQFGVVPWYFDEETNTIVKKYVNLRETVVFLYISTLGLDGQPIIRPIWWVEPEKEQTFNISDQFLVGDQILVAPILDEGHFSRDVYFPGRSTWYDPEEKCSYYGSQTYYNLTANLDRILYFYSETFVQRINLNITNINSCR